MPVQKPAKSAKPAAVAGEKTVSLPAAKAATKASTVSTPKSKAQLLKEAADELLKNAESQEKKKPARKPKATADADAATADAARGLRREPLVGLVNALLRRAGREPLPGSGDPAITHSHPDWLVQALRRDWPDVVTLDVEMPRMDGLDFLEKLMRLRPMPVVMVSSLTGKGSEVTLRALELGAIDFVTKPQLGIREGMLAYSEMIAEKVRTAAKASLAAHKPLSAPTTLKAGPLLSSEKLIAIGASTGGTEAIRHVLQPLPLSSPALLITQHMPPGFTRSFADRLNKLCQIGVKEAEDGERVLPGHAYIAPGDRHMELARSGANYQIKIHDGPAVNRHRPSVDVLFHSVAKQAGRNAVGVILTGMGNDGAAGMLAIDRKSVV